MSTILGCPHPYPFKSRDSGSCPVSLLVMLAPWATHRDTNSAAQQRVSAHCSPLPVGPALHPLGVGMLCRCQWLWPASALSPPFHGQLVFTFYKNDEKVFSLTRKELEQTLKRTASPGAKGGIRERNPDDREEDVWWIPHGPSYTLRSQDNKWRKYRVSDGKSWQQKLTHCLWAGVQVGSSKLG